MALIPAYKYELQTVNNYSCDAGGFNKRTKKFKPFESMPEMYEALDAITAAVEAGVIDTDKWVSQLFASLEVFNEFMEELAFYDTCFRLMERWYAALARLAQHENVEEGFTHTDEIADALREAAEETNQI